MKIKEIKVKELASKSNIGGLDYAINPYVGCSHACRYCYACFMKKMTNHDEPWGTFVDAKIQTKPINPKKLIGKSVFMSSVTDPYLPQERDFEITRNILKQIKDIDCSLTITTKSNLILRDLDLLKEFKDLTVAFSINTTDEKFKRDMDKASPINERINALKTLHENGIRTVVFQSPMFPYITDYKSIIELTRDYADEYWFENLNLRPPYKNMIMKYIQDSHPGLFKGYIEIYVKGQLDYWYNLKSEITEYCSKEGIIGHNYFHY